MGLGVGSWIKETAADVGPEALGFLAGGPAGSAALGGLTSGIGGGGAAGQMGVLDAVTGGALGDVVGGITGQTAATAALSAAEMQAQGQREQLEYLKEINRQPQQYREQALSELASAYGLEGEGGQLAAIERAKASPLYQEIMAGREAGEEAVMRQASTTGGLRSGNVQSALAEHGSRLQNQALTQAYGQQMAGLQGLAGIPTGGQQIGQTMADIGATMGAGTLGAGQAQQQGIQNMMNMGLMALPFII